MNIIQLCIYCQQEASQNVFIYNWIWTQRQKLWNLTIIPLKLFFLIGISRIDLLCYNYALSDTWLHALLIFYLLFSRDLFQLIPLSSWTRAHYARPFQYRLNVPVWISFHSPSEEMELIIVQQCSLCVWLSRAAVLLAVFLFVFWTGSHQPDLLAYV